MSGYGNSNYNACLLEDVRVTGNIIPTSWYEHIRLSNDKPDTNAILLLAEIFYWFRPFREDGELKQKFAGDKLHLSYKQIEDKFGFTRNQARAALKRLTSLGLITVEERGFRTPEGDWHRRLFIDLDSESLLSITNNG